MHVEILSIGDELLIGQTVNTNAAWMGEQLLQIGVVPDWVTTVGDNADRLFSAMRVAEERADIVLLTGGLGPTHDDITKAVACRFFSSDTVLDETVLQAIRERFARRGIPMARINEEQAQVPRNARVIPNDRGTAPGMIFTENNKRFYIMPGVPFEMQSMMQRVVLPELVQLLGAKNIETRTLATTGIAESTLFAELGDMKKLEASARVAFLPSLCGVRIRLTATADRTTGAVEKLNRAENWIRERVGDFIYANRDIGLEAVLAEELIRSGKTVAVVESCTGGLLASRLTDIPGSSNYFMQGVVAYSNKAKHEVVGVPQELLEKHGAVSRAVAEALAEGIRGTAKTTFGLAVTGIAGPGGATAQKPVGLVYIACAEEGATVIEEHRFADDRLGNKMRTAQAALNLLRKSLFNLHIK